MKVCTGNALIYKNRKVNASRTVLFLDLFYFFITYVNIIKKRGKSESILHYN